MFTNKKINDVNATRYTASWLRAGGQLRNGADLDNFRDWLISLNLDEEDIDHIIHLAMCGKLELQTSARRFINKR